MFRVKPLTAEEFAAVKRHWAIWLRWRVAYDSGRTTVATHPALPEDRLEHGALSHSVAAAMCILDDAKSLIAHFERDTRDGKLYVRCG